MLRKSVQTTSLLILGLVSLIAGIMCINAPRYFLTILYYGISITFSLVGFFNVLFSIFSKERKSLRSTKFISGAGQLVVGIIIYSHPIDILSILPYIIGSYGLVTALVCFINYYVYTVDHIKGRLFILIEAFVYLIFSILLIIRPFIQTRYLLIILGFYLVFYGIINIHSFIQSLYPSLNKHKYKMTLPVFMNALLPQKLVRYINAQIRKSGADSEGLKAIRDKKTPYDIEILIHLGDKGFDSVGHVDIAFRDIVLSYGCHDHHKTHLGGALGPGIIHFAEKSKYMHFVCEQRNKSLIGFGLHLNEKEKANIIKTLLDMSERFVDWYSDYDLKQMGLEYSGDCSNYASLLSKEVSSKFYKFSSGKFKTYFVMTTNCCLLADSIVGKSGLDLIKFAGIVTPGAYYEYLSSEFLLPNTKVVSRTIYMRENISTLKDNPELVEAIHNIKDIQEFIKTNIF